MLTIKEQMTLKSLNGIHLTPIVLNDRIGAIYRVMNLEITAEDFWHLISNPPEIFLAEAENVNVSIYNHINNQNVKMELINQLINRILLSEKDTLSYQDRVYITILLQKLGIKKIQEFMKDIRQNIKESQYQRKMTDIYWYNGMLLKQIVKAAKTLQKRKTEPDIEVGNRREVQTGYYLHSCIYRRLQTAILYNEVYEQTKPYAAVSRQITNQELNMAEQVRVSGALLLSELRKEYTDSNNGFIEFHINRYEAGINEREIVTKEKAVERKKAIEKEKAVTREKMITKEKEVIKESILSDIVSAVIIGLVRNIYQIRGGQIEQQNHVQYDVVQSLCHSMDNTLKRYKLYHMVQNENIEQIKAVWKKIHYEPDKNIRRSFYLELGKTIRNNQYLKKTGKSRNIRNLRINRNFKQYAPFIKKGNFTQIKYLNQNMNSKENRNKLNIHFFQSFESFDYLNEVNRLYDYEMELLKEILRNYYSEILQNGSRGKWFSNKTQELIYHLNTNHIYDLSETIIKEETIRNNSAKENNIKENNISQIILTVENRQKIHKLVKELLKVREFTEIFQKCCIYINRRFYVSDLLKKISRPQYKNIWKQLDISALNFFQRFYIDTADETIFMNETYENILKENLQNVVPAVKSELFMEYENSVYDNIEKDSGIQQQWTVENQWQDRNFLQEIQEINQRNIELHQQYKQQMAKQQEAGTFLQVNGTRTMNEALKILQNQNQYQPEDSGFIPVVSQSSIIDEGIRKLASKETIQIFETILGEKAGENNFTRYESKQEIENNSITIHNISEAEWIQNIMETQYKNKVNPSGLSADMNPDTERTVKFIHRESAYGWNEEKSESFLQNRQKEKKQENYIRETVKNHTVDNRQVSMEKKEVVSSSKEELSELVQRNMKQQIEVITDRVYNQIEKKLQMERKRRGY